MHVHYLYNDDDWDIVSTDAYSFINKIECKGRR